MRHVSPRPSPSRARVPSRALLAGLLGLTVAGLAPAAPAQLDVLPTSIEVNQVIQQGATTLVAGRTTFVRVGAAAPGATGPVSVDGLLRVVVDGSEASFSPVFSDNGPFLISGHANPEDEGSTLNFVFLAPASDDVVLSVEINPAGPNFVPESNTGNNELSTASLSFEVLGRPELAYAPIDYRPSGGGVPNLPDPVLIEPGVGDNFVQGIFPAADIDYHRIDAPSKLWTSSLSSSGSPLLSSLEVDLALMDPEPDFLYGWIPGGLSYNGQSIIGGQVSMGNTEPIRHQRTYAHELGHNTGLFHNSTIVNLVGVDVERHLNITQGLPRIKDSSLNDIMVPGLLTQQAWVATGSYGNFLNHPSMDPGADQAIVADEGPQILVSGLWNTATGSIEPTHVLTLPAGRSSASVPAAEADLVLRASAGGELVRELLVASRTSADGCGDEGGGAAGAGDGDGHGAGDAAGSAPGESAGAADSADAESTPAPLVTFTVRLPATSAGGLPVDRIVIGPAGARPVQPVELLRSSAAPAVTFTAPGGAPVPFGPLLVSWTATDADGDALSAYLRYSPDGERLVPLATGIAGSAHEVDLAALPALVDGRGYFELLVSDGLHTTVRRSAPLRRGPSWAAVGAGGNAPWAHVLTPDSGFSYLKGATVVLHAMGWDLEDRAIDGAGLQWSSDVDGPLGAGRVTATADLSVGTHVISVTATDSGDLQAIDSATITIVDRGLPTTEICQDDLGFGGPGAVTFSMCGGELSTGSTADLVLTGGPPSTLALLFLSTTFDPTPIEGGVLVPVPIDLLLAFSTDGNGDLIMPGIGGGGGPLTVYAQFVLVDGAQTFGYAFSNALRLEFLP